MRFLLCACILLTLNQVASSDVKQEHVLMGKDVHLLIQTPDLIQDARRLTWKCNETDILEYTFNGKTEFTFLNYRGRVTFSQKDYSLLLKNLTKSDIGLYQAVLSKDEEVSIAKYNVTVQDLVSPVNVTVVQVSSSGDSCNLTVTCSSDESSVTNTFTCDNNQTCSQEGGESSEVMTSTGLLSLYISDKSVVCNHSSQVSWSNDTKPVFCVLNDLKGVNIIIIVISVVCIALIAALCGAGVIAARKWIGGVKYDVANTTYASVKTSDPAMTNADSANAQHPDHGDMTIYSVVQHHSGPAPTATTETRNTTATTPETLYSQVKKPVQSTN